MAGLRNELKRIRKLRNLSRQKLAEIIGVTAQTVANIEENPSYNLCIKLMKKLEKALNVTITIHIKENEMSQGQIRFGNDEAILYIRKNHPDCATPNNILGKMIWEWLRERGGQKIEEDKPSMWGSDGNFLGETGLPATAAQFEFERSLMIELFNYLDLLGQS